MNFTKEVKERVKEALFNRDVWIKQVNESEIRTRCPNCGDSIHSLNTGHLYIRIDLNDNFPMLYHCFRCDEYKGMVDKEFLIDMGIYDDNLFKNVQEMNRKADKIEAHKYLNNTETIFLDYHIPEINLNDNKTRIKLDYIFNRLGVSDYDIDDIKRCKIITSFRDFILENDIKEFNTTPQIAMKLEEKYIGFLSYGNTYILFRDITETEKLRWIKYPIVNKSKGSRIFYAMASVLDILSLDNITVNIAEGVVDIMSCFYNLDGNKPNTLNIASCGKGYYGIIKYLIEMGLFGSNVTINIYADNDKAFNKKIKKDDKSITDMEYFNKVLKNIKYLFGEINIFYNEISKDIGVTKDEIILSKNRMIIS